MTDLASLGLAVDSGPVKAASEDLDKFAEAGDKAAEAADKVSGALEKSRNPAKQFGDAFQAANANSKLYSEQANKVVDSLATQFNRLNMTGRAFAEFTALQKAGVPIGSDAAKQISAMALANYDLEHASEHAGDSIREQRTKFTALAEAANLAGSRLGGVIQQYGGLVIGSQHLTPTLIGTTVAIGALAAAFQFLISTEKAAAEISHTAQYAGINPQALQGLIAAGGSQGADSDTINKTMIALNQQLLLAKSNAGQLGVLFRGYGISAKEPVDAFMKLSALVSNTSDFARKFLIVQQAGIPVTAQLVDTLNLGPVKLREMMESSTKLTDQQLKDARELEDKWNELWTNFETWGKKAIVNIADYIKDQMPWLFKTPLELVSGFLSEGTGYKKDYDPSTFPKGPASTAVDNSIFSNKTFAPTAANADQIKMQNALQLSRNKMVGDPWDTGIIKAPGANDNKDKTGPTAQEQAARNAQDALHLSTLGAIATVDEQVRLKQIQLNQANAQGAGISETQMRAILNLTRTQMEQAQLQEKATYGVAKSSDIMAQAQKNVSALVQAGKIGVNDYTTALIAQTKAAEDLAKANAVAGAQLPNLKKMELDSGDLRLQLDQLATTSLNAVSPALQDMFNGVTKVGDGFKNLGLVVVKALEDMIIKMTIVTPIAKALQTSLSGVFSGGGGIGSFFASIFSANGNVFQNGMMVQQHALGGVVSHPGVFPMANGGIGSIAEKEPEAIMPLRRTASGRLGVELAGASSTRSSGDVVFAPTINAPGATQEDIQAAIAKAGRDFKAQIVPVVRDAQSRGAL